VQIPEVRYAKTPDGISIAYQVVDRAPAREHPFPPLRRWHNREQEAEP